MKTMSSSTARKELFLDDQEIEALDGLRRDFHKPTPYADHSVLRPQFAWEGGNISPSTVIYDPLAGRFRMWYQVYYRCQGSAATSEQQEVPWPIAVSGMASVTLSLRTVSTLSDPS